MEMIIIKEVWGVFSNRKNPEVNAAPTLIICIHDLMPWDTAGAQVHSCFCYCEPEHSEY